MKKCSHCGHIKHLKDFYRNKSCKDGFSYTCKLCARNQHKKYNKTVKRKKTRNRYANSDKGKLQQKNYRKTLRGYLHRKYWDTVKRCNDPRSWYHNVGIQFKFGSAKEFVNWVLENCIMPPMPFDIHRPDAKRHYEPGNIEFLTREEHVERHRTKVAYK